MNTATGRLVRTELNKLYPTTLFVCSIPGVLARTFSIFAATSSVR